MKKTMMLMAVFTLLAFVASCDTTDKIELRKVQLVMVGAEPVADDGGGFIGNDFQGSIEFSPGKFITNRQPLTITVWADDEWQFNSKNELNWTWYMKKAGEGGGWQYSPCLNKTTTMKNSESCFVGALPEGRHLLAVKVCERLDRTRTRCEHIMFPLYVFAE